MGASQSIFWVIQAESWEADCLLSSLILWIVPSTVGTLVIVTLLPLLVVHGSHVETPGRFLVPDGPSQCLLMYCCWPFQSHLHKLECWMHQSSPISFCHSLIFDSFTYFWEGGKRKDLRLSLTILSFEASDYPCLWVSDTDFTAAYQSEALHPKQIKVWWNWAKMYVFSSSFR